MSGNPLDSWTQQQIYQDHSEQFFLFSCDNWMFFKLCKNISCLVSEPKVCDKHSFHPLGSVTVLPTDMVRKRCTGANPSAALDSTKAGRCVSVSSAFYFLVFGFEILSINHCAGVTPLWWVTRGGWVAGTQFTHQQCMCSSRWSQLELCWCKSQGNWISDVQVASLDVVLTNDHVENAQCKHQCVVQYTK